MGIGYLVEERMKLRNAGRTKCGGARVGLFR